MLTDTHCHLDFSLFDPDRSGVLERAWSSGIQKLLIPQVELPLSDQAITLSNTNAQIYLAIGIHPNSAATWRRNSAAELQKLAAHPKVVAFGEIGLDFYRDHATPQQQIKVLNEQLELAAESHKPIILHCRDAFKDLLEQLVAWVKHNNIGHPPYGVFHSFSGSPEEAKEIVNLGFYLGINGVITFKNAETLRCVIQAVGADVLLLETDAPFLAPVPHRGERNEPSYIVEINRTIANLLSITEVQCAKMTYNNAVTLFNW